MRESSQVRELRLKIKSEIESALDSGLFTSCFLDYGYLENDHESNQMYFGCDERSLFDLASMSKALVMSPLAYRTGIELGLSLDGPISSWSSDLNLPDNIKKITIRRLLSHTSGLPAWRNFWVNRLDSRSSLPTLAMTALDHIESVFRRANIILKDVGKDAYSDVGMILLSYLIQKVRGEKLETSFNSLIADQLNLKEPGYLMGGPDLLVDHFKNAVMTSYCPIRGRNLQGEVHDENCFALGGFSGNAGLFGTGTSVSLFLKASRGCQWLRDYFDENAFLLANSTSPGLLGLRRGIDSGSQAFGSGLAMGHLGFTGTAFWLQPQNGRYVVLLTNRVISGRVSRTIQTFRSRIMGLVEQILDLSA